MNDDQLLRYGRQILLPQVDIAGQDQLLQSTALIIGLGGLGSPVAMYLASAGVGRLILVDFDTVELSNLQRQIIHHTTDLGRPKVESAKDTLQSLNPEIDIVCINQKLDEQQLAEQVRQADVVIDGSDNFATRFLVNRVCVKQHTPLVSGAAIRMEGQLAVFMNDGNGPCYNCLYKDEGNDDIRCSENGVLAPVVGIIGSLQATEAIKVLLGHYAKQTKAWVLIVDAAQQEWRKLHLNKDPDCPICVKNLQ